MQMNENFRKVEIREIDLNLTNRCNLSCIHCAFSSHSHAHEEIDFGRLCSFIDEAKDFGVQDLHLTGGEPTLFKKLPGVMKIIAEKNIESRLITNGHILSLDKLKAYKDLGLQSIMFSIDGLEETHNIIRGSNVSFKRCIKSVEFAKDLNMKTRVNAVISKRNKDELLELIMFMKKLDVDVFSFFLYSPTGRLVQEQLNFIMEPSEWRELIDSTRELINSEAIVKPEIVFEKGYLWEDEEMDFSQYQGRGGGCFYLNEIIDYLILLANGDLYPCALLTDKNVRYGNIYERSLRDILVNPENRDVYESFRNQTDHCDNCVDWIRCHGACKSYAYSYYNDWNRSDPRCHKIKKEKLRYIPLCPLHKENLLTGKKGGYSEIVLKQEK